MNRGILRILPGWHARCAFIDLRPGVNSRVSQLAGSYIDN
jgi:hypothetical protein